MAKQDSALKGTVYGILFTLPIWAVIIWVVWRWLGG